jgi:putative DNA-invertase from lambdoid prophage Rac
MGEAMFTIIAAIAKLERDIISERVQGGLRRARESGKILGRPKARIDIKKIKELRAEGVSIREIAKRTTYIDRNGRKRKASKSVIDRILHQNS